MPEGARKYVLHDCVMRARTLAGASEWRNFGWPSTPLQGWCVANNGRGGGGGRFARRDHCLLRARVHDNVSRIEQLIFREPSSPLDEGAKCHSTTTTGACHEPTMVL